jgi:hypothetical protein
MVARWRVARLLIGFSVGLLVGLLFLALPLFALRALALLVLAILLVVLAILLGLRLAVLRIVHPGPPC